ncbi:MAG: SURF1 family cytochrome oxidase biogenesis protein [Defluviimonas denitrificans]
MAKTLGTEPLLIVLKASEGDQARTAPVDTSAIPNDHLNYAITWFSLALVWAGMTGFLLWRIRQTADLGAIECASASTRGKAPS